MDGTETNEERSSELTSTQVLTFDKVINDELLCQILLYLQVENLLIVPQVCRRWKNTDAEDEMLWSPHVTSLWKDKQVNQPTDLILMQRVKSLPLSAMKRALFRVDISRCVEKPDFHNMLIARLIFGDRSPVKRQGRIFYPEWALHLGTLDYWVICYLLLYWIRLLCVCVSVCVSKYTQGWQTIRIQP